MSLKPVSILLLFSLLITNFSNLFLFAGFELNRNYIATELCMNKSKPELHCNGQCFLMKKLKQAQEKEEKKDRQSQMSHFQEALVNSPIVFKRYAVVETKLHIPISMGMPRNIKNSIFQPPRV
ncbi:MAG: hypothetical protein WC623_12915 [Pedobacter sp.]|uniref:hypothetical protein n=1 Tax=Pedobacter sp. TaxID=1411316 RepID=UPI003569818C